MSLNLASLLRNSAAATPSLTATIDDAGTLTFAQLDEAARRFGGELRAAGLKPGDCVALMVPNVPGFTIAYFGTLYAGCVVVPLNTLLVANEVAFQLEDSEARALVVHPQTAAVAVEAAERVPGCGQIYAVGFAAAALPPDAKRLEDVIQSAPACDLAQTAGDETAVILYTSGTTGKPKGAELTHFGLYYNAQLVAERGDQYLDDVTAEDQIDLWRARSLVQAGIRVAAGTDAPFGSADPWVAVRAAIRRRSGRRSPSSVSDKS